MNMLGNIVQTFKHGNALTRLIFLNVAVFTMLKVLAVVLMLFNLQAPFSTSYLAAPSDVNAFIHRPWTLFSYMFLHTEFLHLLFNMVALYWFGKVFLLFFTKRQLVGLYVVGGIFAALVYIISFNVFPYYSPLVRQSLLLGASGSIMAIIVAAAVQSPNMQLQLLLVGTVKLKYIAIVYVVLSFFGITSDNGGGQLAHLGGAFAGYMFVVSLRAGIDFTKGINQLLDGILNLFRPRKMKVKYNQNTKNNKMTDAEYNMNKAKKMAQIDHILDKIKSSGYESLSTDEKRRLFEQSNIK
jgi:membrane associated rhomboid family serine protease